MPHYQFQCLECKNAFNRFLSVLDYERGRIICPHCGREDVEERWSVFTALSFDKSA